MKTLKQMILTAAAATALVSSGSLFAFGDSFSFGDSWGDKWDVGKSSWSTPDWGMSYSRGPGWGGAPGWGGPGWGGAPGWGAPAYYPARPMYYYPRLDSYDRSIMRQQRQRTMSQHDDAMDNLADMLYGRYPFDREKAVRLAHDIELLSNESLWSNFHPGAVVTDGSNTSTTLWGNEAAFKSYADAMRAAAADFRQELQKTPKEGESAIYPSRFKGFDYRKPDDGSEAEAMSPDVFGKFDNLANSCRACHSYFRLPDWW